MQVTCVQSLGWEDPLEKEMATFSSILAQKIPWMEELAGYNPWGDTVGHNLATKQQQHCYFITVHNICNYNSVRNQDFQCMSV